MGVNTALLNSWRDSHDTAEREPAITSAAEVLEPELVADMTVDAVRADRFLIVASPGAGPLPAESNDYDRRIAVSAVADQRWPNSLNTDLDNRIEAPSRDVPIEILE
jgi:hypothetical protein